MNDCFQFLFLSFSITYFQIHSDRSSSSVRAHLSNAYYCVAAIFRVVFCIVNNDTATVGCVGHAWPGRANIFLYNTQKGRQIDKKILICRWFSVAMHRDYHFIFMHLLYRPKATTKAKQAHLQQYKCGSRFIEIDWIASGAGTRRQSPHRDDVDNFHMLFTVLFAAQHCQYIR